jgi:uncharacterized BrkB/YihY/UPF0761 family membrane protein
MIVFVILGQVPLVLAVAQVAMVYLAWIELRKESGLTFEAKLWWCLLVFLFNVIGFAALWVWVTARRRRDGASRA